MWTVPSLTLLVKQSCILADTWANAWQFLKVKDELSECARGDASCTMSENKLHGSAAPFCCCQLFLTLSVVYHPSLCASSVCLQSSHTLHQLCFTGQRLRCLIPQIFPSLTLAQWRRIVLIKLHLLFNCAPSIVLNTGGVNPFNWFKLRSSYHNIHRTIALLY